MSGNPLERGKKAEERVLNLASQAGFNARRARPEEDCGGKKTDVVIDDTPFQVSCQPKSKQQREKLHKLGVSPIAAGEEYTDESIISAIINFFRNL